MAGKVGQIIPRDERIWLVRIFYMAGFGIGETSRLIPDGSRTSQSCQNEYPGGVQQWRRECPPGQSFLGTRWNQSRKRRTPPFSPGPPHRNTSPPPLVLLAPP